MLYYETIHSESLGECMSTVWIRFGDKRDYPIVVNPGVLTEVGALAQKQVRGKTACLISHPRIYRWYGNPVESSEMTPEAREW